MRKLQVSHVKKIPAFAALEAVERLTTKYFSDAIQSQVEALRR